MDRQTCPICNGAGSITCHGCGGTGAIFDPSNLIAITLTHEICRGTGRIKCPFPGCMEGWIETRSKRIARVYQAG